MVSANFLVQALFAAGAVASAVPNVFARTCTSDDSCLTGCRKVKVEAQGVAVTPKDQVIAKARAMFQDFHCVNGTCECALTSDDQAQDFCKFWIENDKTSFKNARYINGGIDADRGVVYCVFVTPA